MAIRFAAIFLMAAVLSACNSNKQPKSPCACDFQPVNAVGKG